MVLGHTSCGAVKVSVELEKEETKSIGALKKRISIGLGSYNQKDPTLNLAVRNNVRSALQYILTHSKSLKSLFIKKQIKFIKGVYDLNSGLVQMIEI